MQFFFYFKNFKHFNHVLRPCNFFPGFTSKAQNVEHCLTDMIMWFADKHGCDGSTITT